MTERLRTEQDPRQRVLGTIDGIVADNPKLSGLLPDGSVFTFSVGYCARVGESRTPRQVVVANRPAYNGTDRMSTIVIQAANREEDFRFWHVEPSQAADILTQTQLEDDQLDDLQRLLADTEFDDGRLIDAFGAQYEQFMISASPEARWWQGLLQEPVADLR